MKVPTLWFCLFSCAMLCGADEVGKVITVDKSKFSEVYPAVWFSPGTGELVSIKEKSERPPEEKYEIWIEPSDPEFGFLVGRTNAETKGVGFSLVGKGVELFEKTDAWQATNLNRKLTRLMKEAQGADGLVFYCKGTKSACLIMITQMDTKKEMICFRWRPLTNQQR